MSNKNTSSDQFLTEKEIFDYFGDGSIFDIDYFSGDSDEDEGNVEERALLCNSLFSYDAVGSSQLFDDVEAMLTDMDNVQVGLDDSINISFEPRPSTSSSAVRPKLVRPVVSPKPRPTVSPKPRPTVNPRPTNTGLSGSPRPTNTGPSPRPTQQTRTARLSHTPTGGSGYVIPDPLEGIKLTSKYDIKWVRQPFQKPIFENICVPNFEWVPDTLGSEPFEYFSRYITQEIIDTLALKLTFMHYKTVQTFQP